jgi:hypothetical protein
MPDRKAYHKAYYEKNKDYYKDYREKNKDRIKAYRTVYNKAYRENNKNNIKNYYQKNKEKIKVKTKAYLLQKRYGLTEEGREELWDAQDKRCAVCGTMESTSKNPWHIDHCHTTNTVRGILCHACNMMLGLAKDNITTLQQAIRYLTNSLGA